MTAYPSRPDVLARRDARLHRCGGCGGWCYGAQPCGTCADGATVLTVWGTVGAAPRHDAIRQLRDEVAA